ncbi:MAG: hypothetical protein WDW38_008249 [Sanguina aurantia]
MAEASSRAAVTPTAGFRPQEAALTAFATCLTNTIRQCSAAVPDRSTASALWAHCSRFALEQLWVKNVPETTIPDMCGLLVQNRIAELLSELLAALVPMLQAQSPSKQGGSGKNSSSGSSSSSGGSEKPRGGTEHSRSAAASRASRVLWERRLTTAGPFPPDLVCVLGCVLKALYVVCEFIYDNNSLDNNGMRPPVFVSLADALLQGGRLLEHLDTALAFLLRCVRHVGAQPTPPAGAPPSNDNSETAGAGRQGRGAPPPAPDTPAAKPFHPASVARSEMRARDVAQLRCPLATRPQ